MELFHIDGMSCRNAESGHIVWLHNCIQSCVLSDRRIWTHHASASILHEKNNQTWKIGEQYTQSCVVGGGQRVHTEWQWPLSGVHSNMIEKWALTGEGGGCTLTPLSFYLVSRTKLQCALHLRGQIHSPYFISTPISTLWWRLFESSPRASVVHSSKTFQRS